jgi:sulfur relay (sulfurtransferase) complex TusBCD TusD component (DsrE family)
MPGRGLEKETNDMAVYLLIETKNPLDGGTYAFELGKQLKAERHDVTVFLLQDAVFAARQSFKAGAGLRKEARSQGLRVLADEVALRERGLVGDRVAKDVEVSTMDELVDLLMERSDKAIWH